MLKVQLDDRALFLSRWRDLALQTVDEAAVRTSPPLREFRRLLEQGWTGRASVDSTGYRLAKAFRLRVAARVLDPLFAPVASAGHLPAASLRAPTTDGPLWTLVTEQPLHLLPEKYDSWKSLLLQAADDVVRSLTENGRALASRTWGEANTARIRHPLSGAFPSWLARWLDMPTDQLPGDSAMPRVQWPTGGASERMAVTPGREEEGYFHMPGGQSGHPLSPHYRDMHAAWEKGEPTPFLPGRTVHTLLFEPSR
jgi:penicillin amidase